MSVPVEDLRHEQAPFLTRNPAVPNLALATALRIELALAEMAKIEIEPNAAMRTSIRMAEAFNRGDWDTINALVTPTRTIEDRRPIVGITTDFDEAQFSSELVYDGGGRFEPPELIATRGDRAALSRWMLRGPNYETPYLAVTRVDADGRVDLQIQFEPEALAEALAVLAELEIDDVP